MKIEGYHWASGPVTEYKRLSDVLKTSENLTRLPEPEERCTTGKEPSHLPPSLIPARGPCRLPFMRGPKMAYPAQDQIQSLSTDGIPWPSSSKLHSTTGAKLEAWALKALGSQDHRARAPPPR